ncbi:MAG: YHS domain-containing protein, partial [Mesorhizobium sp.]
MTDHHHEADHARASHGSCCSSHSPAATSIVVIRDPVCGMTVDPAAGKPSATFGGHSYHFCSEGCRTKFMKEPEAFLKATDPV